MSIPMSIQENWPIVSQLETLSGNPLGSMPLKHDRINEKGLSGKCLRLWIAISPRNPAAPHLLPPITNWCFIFYFHHYNQSGKWGIYANVWRKILGTNKYLFYLSWDPIMAEYFISKWRIRRLINGNFGKGPSNITECDQAKIEMITPQFPQLQRGRKRWECL